MLDSLRLQAMRRPSSSFNLSGSCVTNKGSREIVSLKYSRDPQEKVTARLQSPLEAQRHDAGLIRKVPSGKKIEIRVQLSSELNE
jgi:hypothetical protein